jgi:hypothetical protein
MIGIRLIKNDAKQEINSPVDPEVDAYLDDLWKSMKVGSVKKIK